MCLVPHGHRGVKGMMVLLEDVPVLKKPECLMDYSIDYYIIDTAFTQQELSFTQLNVNFVSTVIVFLVFGIIALVLGATSLVYNQGVVEVVTRYDNVSQCWVSVGNPNVCQVNVTIPSDMTAPIYLYYQLTNFYSNHRLYIKSRSDFQLDNKSPYNSIYSSDCDPISNFNSTPNYPCGLIAGSKFSDNFGTSARLSRDGTPSSVSLQNTGLAWAEDLKYKFIVPSSGVDYSKVNISAMAYPNTNNTNIFEPSLGIKDEELVVWMRTSTLADFRKLNRIINTNLKAGDVLSFTVSTRFSLADMSGTKSIVLSTTSYFGGKNLLLGVSLIVVGVVVFLFGLVVLVYNLLGPSRQRSRRATKLILQEYDIAMATYAK